MTDVYLEQGRTWTFACAVDWPGWARRGKGDHAALEELLSYADRYAAVVPGFSPGELQGAELRKGPRGGGRDRDRIAAHVQEAERSYGRMLGVRVPPRTPWPEQRAQLEAAVRAGDGEHRWPLRYAARRFAWHVLDHAWEIQDKQPEASPR